MATDLETEARKPLGCRAYGSIGHLPGSRLGPGDHHVPEGQADICCRKCRQGDLVVVEEKLDGSCCAVAKLMDGSIVALTRAGYLASSSPHEQHWLFAAWVADNHGLFRWLPLGWRVVGEWIAQAHGTIYGDVACPFFCFDVINDKNERVVRDWWSSINGRANRPHEVHRGGPISVEAAWHLLQAERHTPTCDLREGLVYRVERKGRVEFLAKWVHPQKIDGLYLPEVSGRRGVWNWGPKSDAE
jgi:hypothetical protein